MGAPAPKPTRRGEADAQPREQCQHNEIRVLRAEIRHIDIDWRGLSRHDLSVNIREIAPGHSRQRLVAEVQRMLSPVPRLTAGHVRQSDALPPFDDFAKVALKAARRGWQHEQKEGACQQGSCHQAQSRSEKEVGEQGCREGLDRDCSPERQPRVPLPAPRVLEEGQIQERHDEYVRLAEEEVVNGEHADEQTGQPVVPRRHSLVRREDDRSGRPQRHAEKAHVQRIPEEEEWWKAERGERRDQHGERRRIAVVR